MSTQTKKMSMVEAYTNAIVGIVISWAFTYWALPALFGITFNFTQTTEVTFCYFILSTARAYGLRRVFTNLKR